MKLEEFQKDQLPLKEPTMTHALSSNSLGSKNDELCESTEYRTSINELISEPAHQNYYTVQNLYSSMYQLSEYLFKKKIKAESSARSKNDEQMLSAGFEDYLSSMDEEFKKYDKSKKSKIQENQLFSPDKFQQSPEKKVALGQSPISRNSQKQRASHSGVDLQLVKCYQKVPYVYFEENFSLDFSHLQKDQKRSVQYGDTQTMQQQQEVMNENLDLVEINLFGQIHRKFEDYFRAAANFDYLRQSINVQLQKIKQARSGVKIVQKEFVENSQTLRSKIVQRNNYEKVLKTIKIMKSLQKLPVVIEAILQSSLPYECLQLLETTKKSLRQVEGLSCLGSIVKNIKSCETIVQLGLNKKYTDELYLYIDQPLQQIDYHVMWKMAATSCSTLEREHNGSVLSHRSLHETSRHDKSALLEELMDSNQIESDKQMASQVRRQQGKEFEIAMILLQSYRFVNFPVDMTKIKVANSMRVFSKTFEKDLYKSLKICIETAKSNALKYSFNQSFEMDFSAKNSQSFQDTQKKPQTEEDFNQSLKQAADEVSIELFVEHLKPLSRIFQSILQRYLGFILTLITEYEDRLFKSLSQLQKKTKKTSSRSIDICEQQQNLVKKCSQHEIQEFHLMQEVKNQHSKFKDIVEEELIILPSMFKIIEQKLKYFLALKNISNASPGEFLKWISILRQWQRWFDTLIEDSPLLNYSCTYFTGNSQQELNKSVQSQGWNLTEVGSEMMEELTDLVVASMQKSINVMSLKNLMADLTTNYLNEYSSAIRSELNMAIEEDSWQSVEIPQQFIEIVNGIVSKPEINQNISLTILNTSSDGSFSHQNGSHNLSRVSTTEHVEPLIKLKVLKNNVLHLGQRYKLTMSFLLFCEFMHELVRVGRVFLGLLGDSQETRESKHSKRIQTNLYFHLFSLAEAYTSTCKEMILEKKALKLQRIKGNNITVKHICLLNNCLTLLNVILEETPSKDVRQFVSFQDKKQEATYLVSNHIFLLTDKISGILNKKVEGFISKISRPELSSDSLLGIVEQSNQSLVTVFLQITEIIDEYLDFDKCDKILRTPFQNFVQKYFRTLILKGPRFQQEMGVTLQKVRFLNKYFRKQLSAMERQVE